MDKQFESIYHIAEDTNWWFKARRNFIGSYLAKNGHSRAISLLDVGCGGGGLLSFLESEGYTNLAGVDISPEAIAYCQKRGLTNVRQGNAEHISEFPSESFDVIVSSDVLEHLNDPDAALSNWFSLLKKNGILILFVPAFMSLWSEHDVVSHHMHRYTKKEIFRLVTGAHFKPLLLSYWNFIMFIPYTILLFIMRFSKEKVVKLEHVDSPLNGFLTKIMLLENKVIISGHSFPFGVSFLAIVKK